MAIFAKRQGQQMALPFFMCARHGVNLGGESPLRAVVVGTVS